MSGQRASRVVEGGRPIFLAWALRIRPLGRRPLRSVAQARSRAASDTLARAHPAGLLAYFAAAHGA